jgi:hypothetical protein
MGLLIPIESKHEMSWKYILAVLCLGLADNRRVRSGA